MDFFILNPSLHVFITVDVQISITWLETQNTLPFVRSYLLFRLNHKPLIR